MISEFSIAFFNIAAILFTCLIGCFVLFVCILYIIDVTQKKQTIRHNYPVIGRFRYIFEHLGEFFRQYFFAMDREELPFNRALRNWVYRASKDVDATLAFGSTRQINLNGEAIFLNAPFPTLDSHSACSTSLRIGNECRFPYDAPSIFNISGMSYGALSSVAITALAKGAKKANCWLNTGEGGLSSFHKEAGCDIIFQIGTAKYGVRDLEGNFSPDKLKDIAALPQVKMFEIKLSQGAKPGKGGMLPAGKISKEIAEIRGIPEGEASISPNRHPNIHNNETLLDFIEEVRGLSGKPTGIKTVMGDPSWIYELCDAINARGAKSAPDFITLDCAEGGTGAAPQPLMDFVGMPLRESLPLLNRILEEKGLRKRVRIIASGKLVAPGAAALAIATGADFITSARGFMFSLGCIQAMQCNKNTCPTGITTHKASLQKGLDPNEKSNRVANYHKQLIKHLEMISHSCGVHDPRELSHKHVRIVTQHNKSIPMKELT